MQHCHCRAGGGAGSDSGCTDRPGASRETPNMPQASFSSCVLGEYYFRKAQITEEHRGDPLEGYADQTRLLGWRLTIINGFKI